MTVHITMVSRKTSTTPIIPCWIGWSTAAEACAMDAVPMPASLVNIPRETPVRSAVSIEPMTPPVTAWGENAPRIMAENAAGIACHRAISTVKPSSRYSPAAKGTSSSAPRPMRLAPPRSMTPIRAASSRPSSSLPHKDSENPKAAAVSETAEITVLICVALPTPRAAITPKKA